MIQFLPRVQRKYDEQVEAASNAVPKGRFTIVEVTTKDGQLYRERVDCPRGAPGNALSVEDLQEKLAHSLAGDQDRVEQD
jgi:2-methylcitrate dehydratase PrpD